jgi:hypothetical protein
LQIVPNGGPMSVAGAARESYRNRGGGKNDEISIYKGITIQ